MALGRGRFRGSKLGLVTVTGENQGGLIRDSFLSRFIRADGSKSDKQKENLSTKLQKKGKNYLYQNSIKGSGKNGLNENFITSNSVGNNTYSSKIHSGNSLTEKALNIPGVGTSQKLQSKNAFGELACNKLGVS